MKNCQHCFLEGNDGRCAANDLVQIRRLILHSGLPMGFENCPVYQNMDHLELKQP